MADPRFHDQSTKDAFFKEYESNGGNASQAARSIGISGRKGRFWAARLNADPSIVAAADAGGIEDISTLSHLWKIAKDEDGNGYSLFIKNPQAGEDVSFSDMVKESIRDAIGDKPPQFESRPVKPQGNQLLVVDLADVHFRKLCVMSETGAEFNLDIARHRVLEGTKALLRRSKPLGVARILFVLGNDALHTDTKQHTTKGTLQDTDGTFFQGWNVALRSTFCAIKLAAELAPVDLIHNMDNHANLSGWTLSQAIAALFSDHPNVFATDYNMSEIYTKYYRYDNCLMGLAHADGAKEEKLLGMMLKEAKQHISDCEHLIWLLHHLHHGVRRTRGAGKPFLREKDHTGMTAIVTGQPRIEGQHLDIQHVRSLTPPDSWHHKHAFINRQAVECFLVDPGNGVSTRFTEWF